MLYEVDRCSGSFKVTYDNSDRKEAEKRLKLPKFRNANIALVELKPKDGMIKKTFGIAHYSWWRTKDFDVSQAKVI